MAEVIEVGVGYDFMGNEIRNFTCEKIAGDPVTPFEGQVWENTTAKRVKALLDGNVETIAFLSDITGATTVLESYNALTNTPDLDTAPSGIKKRDAYYVTVGGTFFGENVQIGDQLIAKIDDPTLVTDWIILETNNQPASETVAGNIEIATQVETDAITDDERAITPLKLGTFVENKKITKKFAVALEDAQASVVRTFAGGVTSYAVTHGFTSTEVEVKVYKISDGTEVIAGVTVTSSTVVTVKFNGNSTDNTYRVVIVA